MNFKRDMAIKQAQNRMAERRIVSAAKRATAKALIGAAVVAGALMCSGYYNGPGKLITEEYVVQRGDCLWDICGQFIEKNSYGPRYLPEFLSGVVENNPELQGKSGHLYPGQRLKITYWVRDDASAQ